VLEDEEAIDEDESAGVDEGKTELDEGVGLGVVDEWTSELESEELLCITDEDDERTSELEAWEELLDAADDEAWTDELETWIELLDT